MKLSSNLIPRSGRLFPATFLTLLLAACGGGNVSSPLPTPAPAPVDLLASFTQQKLDWQPCDPTLMGERANPITFMGERVKCTLMRAPLDYANPALGELKVALLKVSAEQPQNRLGAILFNPGGPGGDGLTMGANYGYLWSLANPADATGKLLKEMSNRYDMIGFSPRGVGSSTSLTCSSNELFEVSESLTFDRSPQNIKKAQRNERLSAEACAKNPLTRYIHTDATARDMDLARSVLGDSKLNFIGYSYGTWLGAWYASLFPERVGRMLLDSSMNVAATFDDAKLLQQMGSERVIDDVILPYAARHAQRFNMGNNPTQIKSTFLGFPPVLKAATMERVNIKDARDFDLNPLVFTASFGLQALSQKIPQADKNAMHAAIESYVFTTGADNLVAARLAHELTERIFAAPARTSVEVGRYDATNMSVTCNDNGTTGNEQHWVDIGNDYAARYPLTGGGTSANPCLYRDGPVGTRPPLALAARAAPLLMVQSRYDALTPIEGAQSSQNALPNASMIVVENEYSHGLFPYSDNCVDPQVAGYFVNGTVPPRTGTCAGKPLPADAATTPQPRRAVSAPATYTDPAQAEEIMRRIKKQIGDANRRP